MVGFPLNLSDIWGSTDITVLSDVEEGRWIQQGGRCQIQAGRDLGMSLGLAAPFPAQPRCPEWVWRI